MAGILAGLGISGSSLGTAGAAASVTSNIAGAAAPAAGTAPAIAAPSVAAQTAGTGLMGSAAAPAMLGVLQRSSPGMLGTMPLAEAALSGNIPSSALGELGTTALEAPKGSFDSFLQGIQPFARGVADPLGSPAGQSVLSAIGGEGPFRASDLLQFGAQGLANRALFAPTPQQQNQQLQNAMLQQLLAGGARNPF